MTGNQALAMLRRRLHEETADHWTDDELIIILNEGILQEQLESMRYWPDAHLTIYKADLASGEQYYDVPDGLIHEVEISVKDSEANTGYRKIDRRDYAWLREQSTGSRVMYYARFSDKIFLGPGPISTETSGLQVIGIGTLSTSSGAMSLKLPLHQGLHYAAVLRAQIIAMGETEESPELLWKELDRIHANLGVLYMKSGGEPEQLDLSAMDKPY